MTEDKHYILPSFLIEGFASRVVGQKIATFVYRKDQKALETNIINVSADADMTPLETEFARLFDDLRKMKDRMEVSNSRTSELIAFLCMRTGQHRNSFRESSEFWLKELYAFVLNPNNLGTIVLNNFELIKENFERASKYNPTFKLYKRMLQLEPSALVAFLNNYRSITEMMLQTFVTKYKGEILERLWENHIEVLAKKPVPEMRTQEDHPLRWFVCVSEHQLILGDFGVLFETTGAKRFKPIPENEDVIKNVFLPISSNQMLIGTSLSSVPQVDFNLINEAIARCCKEFFVSSVLSQEKNRLALSIGKDSWIVSREELEQLIEEIIKSDYEWLNV